MPTYRNSKSQKSSKSQSKNGGRRRKHTMRKLRRGRKSRKVMRGGAVSLSNVGELRGLFEYRTDLVNSNPDLVGPRPDLLKNLQEAIDADAQYNKSIDTFFTNVKGNYKSLSTNTIAAHDILKDDKYKDLRDFLISQTSKKI